MKPLTEFHTLYTLLQAKMRDAILTRAVCTEVAWTPRQASQALRVSSLINASSVATGCVVNFHAASVYTISPFQVSPPFSSVSPTIVTPLSQVPPPFLKCHPPSSSVTNKCHPPFSSVSPTELHGLKVQGVA